MEGKMNLFLPQELLNLLFCLVLIVLVIKTTDWTGKKRKARFFLKELEEKNPEEKAAADLRYANLSFWLK